MTASEFSNQFDVLYNNITSNQAPGLNEYEKSVFLTKAQNELVKNYFLPQSNPKQAGFDGNPKRQLDFSRLLCNKNEKINTLARGTVDPRSFAVNIEDDVLYIINETIQYGIDPQEGTVGGRFTWKAIRQVIPISYDEYTRLMSKPFKEPVKNQAWRLITNISINNTPRVELVLTTADVDKYVKSTENNAVTYYVYRYVKKPMPIILIDLTGVGEDISIDGKKGTSTEGYEDGFCCELDPAVHEEILQRAVELAKVAWEGNVQTVVEAGNRSE